MNGRQVTEHFGGIYRDCRLIVHDNVHITDPNYENEVAGGGLFGSHDKVSEARLNLKVLLRQSLCSMMRRRCRPAVQAESVSAGNSKYLDEIRRLQKELNAYKLKDVEKQKSDFEFTRP